MERLSPRPSVHLLPLANTERSTSALLRTLSSPAKTTFNGDEGLIRNTLTESARISRGQIKELNELLAKDFDALIIPGGFGAALLLSNWAEKGAQAKVLPDVVRVIREFNEDSKPIGAICIAPVLVAKVLGDKEVTLTLGKDHETALEVEKTGAIHEECEVDDFVTDRAHKVVSTPAYMFSDASPFQVSRGIDGLVKEVVEMA